MQLAFFFFSSHRAFLSHLLSSHLKLIYLKLTLSTPISQAHSIYRCRLDSSSTSSPRKLNVTDPPTVPSCRSALNPHRHPPQTHFAVCLRPTSRVMRSKSREKCSVIGNQSIGEDVDSVGSIDAWVCLWFVLGLSPIGDFVWFGLKKKIWGFGFFFFFFFFCCRLVVVVVVDVCAMLSVGCYVWLPWNFKKIWEVCVDILFYCVES